MNQTEQVSLTARIARIVLLGAVVSTFALPCAAQVTPAAGYVPPDDTPSIRVGTTIFADYTVTEKPKTTDADGNEVTPNAFNIGRAYINVTGNISHLVAFRVTPDITRETGTGSSLNGSYTFRLKYAFAQFNLDDWMTRGSWLRFGMQQTPWVDFEESIYRYRFQGTVFSEREGYLSSSDIGASFHYSLPGNYGDIHAGVYNGETYSRVEPNDQKGFMVRGSFRPFRMSPVFRGLRFSGFYDADSYLKNGERRRGIAAVTFEHPYVNAEFSYLDTAGPDPRRASPRSTGTAGRSGRRRRHRTTSAGKGWCASIISSRTRRWTAGATAPSSASPTGSRIRAAVSTALLFDFENVDNKDFAPVRPDERRYAVHALVNF